MAAALALGVLAILGTLDRGIRGGGREVWLDWHTGRAFAFRYRLVAGVMKWYWPVPPSGDVGLDGVYAEFGGLRPFPPGSYTRLRRNASYSGLWHREHAIGIDPYRLRLGAIPGSGGEEYGDFPSYFRRRMDHARRDGGAVSREEAEALFREALEAWIREAGVRKGPASDFRTPPRRPPREGSAAPGQSSGLP